jgi:hypothetical protein
MFPVPVSKSSSLQEMFQSGTNQLFEVLPELIFPKKGTATVPADRSL